jgi:hypothetical protein
MEGRELSWLRVSSNFKTAFGVSSAELVKVVSPGEKLLAARPEKIEKRNY